MRSFIGSNNKPEKSLQDSPQQNNESTPTISPYISSQQINSRSASSKPATSTPKETTTTATIGPKIQISGEVVGDEDIVIHGKVEGVINLKNHTVTVGKQGVVNADIIAKVIKIEGMVQGELFGEEQIIVHSNSQVRGNLAAERVSLEDGAKFYGAIDMDVDARKKSAEPAEKNRKNGATKGSDKLATAE